MVEIAAGNGGNDGLVPLEILFLAWWVNMECWEGVRGRVSVGSN